jgi:membrane protease YdiL (CAAX protease family)
VNERELPEWLETLPDHKARAGLGLIAGVAIVLAYVAARFVVYQNLPLRDTQAFWQGGRFVRVSPGFYWWMRDTIMDVPRLIAFGAALWTGRYLWGLSALGWHARCWRLGLTWGGIGAALIVAYSLFRDGALHPGPVLIVLAVSCLIVALYEETLFRGLLFNALYDLGGRDPAIWLSAALFTVYHVQAQPIISWPAIFTMGLLYGVLRWQGVGLMWLIASHALGDALILLCGDEASYVPWWPPIALALRLGIPLGYFIWATRAPLARRHRASDF